MYKNSVNNEITDAKNAMVTWDNMKFIVNLSGFWSWEYIDENYLNKTINSIDLTNVKNLTINGFGVTKLDTVGAYFLNQLVKYCINNRLKPTILLDADNQNLFNRIYQAELIIQQDNNLISNHKETAKQETSTNLITLSKSIFQKKLLGTFTLGITFLGQTCISFIQILKRPLNFDWNELVRTIQDTGIKGIFVVILLNFLIATTLTYEMAPQFTKYGANIYIVNFLGIAMLKEVSPLLTAIIIAGRTGSSITAEIGTMKVQEEIDAIKTMGISPFQKLVIPKILGVVIATPLLTVIADVVGMMGGAIVSKQNLGLTYQLFIERTQDYVSINNYTIGIIKSVAFGFGIAFIGCLCGFKVKGDANSIGEQTTRSVVLSIIMIILLDAIFAIIFMNLKV